MNDLTKAWLWWESFPIQNLQDMSDSWVGYCSKYGISNIYGATDEEVLHMWEVEQKAIKVGTLIKTPAAAYSIDKYEVYVHGEVVSIICEHIEDNEEVPEQIIVKLETGDYMPIDRKLLIIR